MTYESLPIAPPAGGEGDADDGGILTFFKRVKTSLVPGADAARPTSPPPSSTRPLHSRQQSAASQRLGQIASSDGDARHDGELRKPAAASRDSSSSQPSLMRTTTKSSIAPAIRTNKLSTSTAPSVRLLQTTSVHVDLSGRAYTHDEPNKLSRTITMSSDISDGQPSPAYGFIPGFALPNDLVDDDTRSVSSFAGSVTSSRNVLENVRRLQREGKGISKEFWLSDDKAKYCYNCHSVFTVWRRKHHCRVCGQIFCAQCAQNMRPGAPYGYGSSIVRVCDLCAAVYNRTHLDDGRSTLPREDSKPALSRSPTTLERFPSISALTAGPQPRSPLTISSPLEAQEGLKQSRFSASALFPKTEYLHFASPLGYEDASPPDSPAFGSDGGGSPNMSRRGSTPFAVDEEGRVSPLIQPPVSGKAPFRRALTDDEHHMSTGVEEASSDALEVYIEAEAGDTNSKGLGLRRFESSNDEIDPLALRKVRTGESSDGGARGETPGPFSPRSARARANSRAADIDGFTSLSFQRNHSLREHGRRDSFLRSMHVAGDSFTHVELPPASLEYAKELLGQELRAEGVLNAAEWEADLEPLLLKLSRHPTPAGRLDNMAIQSLLRIKKVPGGRPRLTEYVDGVVFTKNVLHKDMSRLVASPRIMLIGFALEYSRIEGQFMSLEPLIQQEKEFLRNLVHRVLSNRPQVILCEKSVARIALDELHEKGVVVAQNVKASILADVARCTQGDVIPSMERLAANPRLGRCGTFRIQSFQHALIPGRRKTLLRFEGCVKEAGATIVLRGGTHDDLVRIKRIVSFLASAVYNMRLERAYLWETHGVLPIRPPQPALKTGVAAALHFPDGPPEIIVELDQAVEDLSHALQPFFSTLLSTSCLVLFPPPYPLKRLLDDVVSLRTLRVRREDEEAARILREERGETAGDEHTGALSRSSTMSNVSLTSTDTSKPSFAFDGEMRPASSATSALTRTFSDQSLSGVAATLYTQGSSSSVAPTTVGQIAEAEAARARHARLFDVYKKFAPMVEQTLRPASRQHLIVLRSKVFPALNRVCEDPELRQLHFYGANDLPLGQYIEDLLASIGKRCEGKECDDMNYLHYEAFVHGGRRVEFHLERGDTSDMQPGDKLSVATYCPACNRRTKTLPVSDLAWRYSFAKFLELGFYADSLVSDVEEVGCPHNLRDFQRYFLLRGFSVRCQIVNISLCDVSMPSLRLRGRADTHLRLRDEELRYMSRASNAFWVSITRRINSYSTVLPHDKLDGAREQLSEMLKKAEADRRAFDKTVHEARNSVDWPSADILNRVRATLNASTEAWERRLKQFNESVALGRESRQSVRRVFSDASAPTSPDQPQMQPLQLPPPSEQDELLPPPEIPTEVPLPTSISDPSLSKIAEPLTVAALARLDSTTATGVMRPSKTAPSSLRRDADAAESDPGSDSTVQADLPARQPPPFDAQSEHDTDFSSSLKPPRRLRTTGTVEALVKRFDSPPSSQGNSPDLQKSSVPLSSPSHGRSTLSSSQSSAGQVARPSLRRNKSEAVRVPKAPPQHLETGILSDGGRDSRRTQKRKIKIAATSPTASTSKIPLRRTSLVPPAATTESRPLSSRASSSTTVKPVISPSTSPRSSRPVSPVKFRAVGMSQPRSAAASPSKRSNTAADAESSESTSPLKSKTRQFTTVGPSRHAVRPPLPRKSSGPPSSSRAGKVLNTVKQFERLGRDPFAQRRQVLRPRQARPMGISKPVLEVFSSMKDALKDDSDEDHADDSGADDEYEAEDAPSANKSASKTGEAADDDQSTSSTAQQTDSSLLAAQAFLSPPIDAGSLLATPLPSVPPSPSPYSTDVSRLSRDYPSGSELSSSEAGQKSIWKNLSLSSVQSGFSSLVASAVDELYPLEYPFLATEHLFENNPVVIREDEPSSIIAHTLRSRDYTEKLRLRVESRKGERADALFGNESDWTHTAGGDHEATDGEETQKRSEGEHLGFHFIHDSVHFDCRVFYADRFDALRRSAQCEEAFIESLTRCVRWETTGGKSGSTFLKTRDDRYIVKELSPSERDAFVKFADNYFRHLSRAFFKDVPTILAKILGMFRISFKGHGRSARLDVLVMENVFYERKITRIYDLKGSMRNRRAPTSGQTQQVLLDENLVEEASSKPIYMRDQSKRLLSMALHNDTHFLAEQNVMDYSLVVGVDQMRGELVVGIIDFVRTYTWDKKLEHWIKNTNKREPTIVTPVQYKSRFRQAMAQYFLLVPDAWTELPPRALMPVVGEAAKTGVPRTDKEKVREREILLALPRAPLPPSCRQTVPTLS